ncbi:response regulator [Rhodanobacter sp. AS-Z3]|uniref:response regulator n=1 Tax=Rhodanobacter sp. AS-Z3 TaxID=3031330 RepID=UPI0024796F60|nr:response regulator [Rhodanobacter sp. AS-Z3]WEN13896.1 response regulator [Rhodanobacter sp. AS-Z3]
MTAKKTVLIVDDNELVLESLDLLLSGAEGFQSIRALGSDGAMRHLRHAPVDIIVADVILAGSVSGIDLCNEAIKRHPDIALVVITADSEVRVDEVPQRGVFLRKPFGATELMVAVQMAQRKVANSH